MKQYLTLFFVLLIACCLGSCGETSSQADQDILTKLWISVDGNEFDLDLSRLRFNQEFSIEFKDRNGASQCICRSTFIGDGDTGQYILNCPSSCPVQFPTLNTTRGSYTHSSEGILELCRNPSNPLLCREYK